MPEDALRQIDRFHPIPDAPEWAESWAEWLYFNGRGPGGRFYLTFLVGPPGRDGARGAGVRLQLDRNGTVESFTGAAPIADADAMRAPNLTVGASSVTLDGMRYRIHLDLADARGRRALGDLVVTGSPGKIVPPIEITGAQGWRTGYVVPVMSGTLNGAVTVDGVSVALDGGTA